MLNSNGQSGRQSAPHQLVSAYQSDVIWNGVTITKDGRVFVCFPHLEADAGIRIGEIQPDGTRVPYPDARWNNWPVDGMPLSTFIHPRSLRVEPDHTLWIVDSGTLPEEPGKAPDGAKLVVITLQTNQVVQVIPLASVLKETSLVDDVRITPSHIYLTDAGAPALIVLDRQTVQGRRILEGDDSVTDMRPMLAEGQIISRPNGQETRIHADQLEVSPDGKYLYFQPASGLMNRIETIYVNDATLAPADLARHVQLFVDTPSTGGTAIDDNGNLYVSDISQSRILTITPEGKTSVLIADARLVWVGAMWIDNDGFLWLPASQQNRLASFQAGQSLVDYPVHLYKLQIGAKPVRSL